ncbi:hypothetical protein CHUAL_005147 [Chamberlinius hualienensis]
MAKNYPNSKAPLIKQFSKQIAGHAVVKGSTKPGMMKHEDGSVLKPILPPPRGLRELNFYKRVFDKDCQDEVINQLRPLLPIYRGVFSSKSQVIDGEDSEYLKLEDVTEKFDKPCILDVKMGAITYDPDASEDKIKREMSKYKGTKLFGFCIPGMRVFDLKKQTYICNGKEFGKNLTQSNIKDAFRLYLNFDTRINCQLIESFLIRLREVHDWFSTQTKFHFFASSLLFVYAADSVINCLPRNSNSSHSQSLNSTQAQTEDVRNITHLKMIDFAHVFDANSVKDDNYIKGLNCLISIFEDLLQDAKQNCNI